MEILKVTTKEELKNLYDHSALTILGVELKSLQEYITWAEETSGETINKVFAISGDTMNKEYGLIGNMRYPSDLNIISIILGSEGLAKIAIPRFELGARWFDDIVDNNARNNEDED